MDKEIIAYQFPNDIQDRGYILFPDDLEDDDQVFFHGTSMKNFETISRDGFKSENALTGSGLTSVTYTKKSIGAFNHVCNKRTSNEDMVVFAVRFTDEDLKRASNQLEEIKIHIPEIQPIMIGYCVVPATYQHR